MTTDALGQQCASQSCCHEPVKPFAHRHKHQEDSMEKAFRLVAKVSALALGVLAAITDLGLFIPAFALGTVIGVATYQKSVHSHKHSHFHGHSSDGGCSHGFMEKYLEIKVPESVGFVAAAAVFAVHIDHHPEVFVPIVGVSVGIWAGNLVAPSLIAGFRKFVAFVALPEYSQIAG